MAFDKVILGVITRTVKSTARFDIAINSIKTQFDNGCPVPQELTKIIQSKNQINQALTQASRALSTVNSTAGTINGILTGIDTAITVIKAIPIPSAITPLAPAGVGPSLIPGKIFPALSDSLIVLRDFVKTNKGVVDQVPSAISSIQSSIQKTIDLLNSLDALILKCLNEQTTNLTSAEKEAYFNQIGFSLSQTGNNSNSNVNLSTNSILEAQLQPNAVNPLIYKDFKLTLEYNNSNKFSFPSRRIKGINDKTKQIIYNYEGNYSYSSSTEVLFDEIKYQIDVLTKTGREADNLVKEITSTQAELTRKKANEAINEINIASSYIDEANKSIKEISKALELAKSSSTIINVKEATKETKLAADKATNEASKITNYVSLVTESARKSEIIVNEAEIFSSVSPSPESISAVEDAKKSAGKANKLIDEINKLSIEASKLSSEVKDIVAKVELTRIKYLEPFGYDGEYDKQTKEFTINDQETQWYYFNNTLAKWIEIPSSNLLPFTIPGEKNNERKIDKGERRYSYLDLNAFQQPEITEEYEVSNVYIWNLETLKWNLFESNETYLRTQYITAYGRSKIEKLSDNIKKELKFNGFIDYNFLSSLNIIFKNFNKK